MTPRWRQLAQETAPLTDDEREEPDPYGGFTDWQDRSRYLTTSDRQRLLSSVAEAAMEAVDRGDDKHALLILKLGQFMDYGIEYNDTRDYHNRGRKFGETAKRDPDQPAVDWAIEEALRTMQCEPYALARRVPGDVLRTIGADKKRYETNVQRIGAKIKTALSKLSIQD